MSDGKINTACLETSPRYPRKSEDLGEQGIFLQTNNIE